MENLLNESIYHTYEEIDKLQKEIQGETEKTPFMERAFRRSKLFAQYCTISEKHKAIELVSEFIDSSITSKEVFTSPIVPAFFMQIIMMSAIEGDDDTGLKYVNRFRELAQDSTVTPKEEGTARIMRVVIEVQTIILRNITDKFSECFEKIKEVESAYNSSIPMYSVDMDISIHEFYGMCYLRMGQLNDAIRIYLDVAEMSENAGRGFRTSEAYKMLSSLYEEKGDMERALEYYKFYNERRNLTFQAKAYAYSQYIMDVYGMGGEEN